MLLLRLAVFMLSWYVLYVVVDAVDVVVYVVASGGVADRVVDVVVVIADLANGVDVTDDVIGGVFGVVYC